MRQYQHRLEPVLASRGRDLPAPVRLGVGASHDGVGAGSDNLAEDELKLPGLVAAEGEAGQVVPLHQDLGTAKGCGEARARLERGGQVGEPCAWEGSEPGAQSRGRERGHRPEASRPPACCVAKARMIARTPEMCCWRSETAFVASPRRQAASIAPCSRRDLRLPSTSVICKRSRRSICWLTLATIARVRGRAAGW